MLRKEDGRAGMAALDFLEEEGLGRIHKVHEGIGPGRDDANGLGEGLIVRRRDPSLALHVIEEALEKASPSRASIAGELAGDADMALPGTLGPRVHPVRAQDASYHLFESPASGDLAKVAGHGLPVIGEDIKVIPELGQAFEDPHELADGTVDMMEGAYG
jgi:hypothetical protein